MQVAQGVHRVTGGVCNFYLVEEGGRLLLVDAGAPRDWDLLVRTLPALGRRLEPAHHAASSIPAPTSPTLA